MKLEIAQKKKRSQKSLTIWFQIRQSFEEKANCNRIHSTDLFHSKYFVCFEDNRRIQQSQASFKVLLENCSTCDAVDHAIITDRLRNWVRLCLGLFWKGSLYIGQTEHFWFPLVKTFILAGSTYFRFTSRLYTWTYFVLYPHSRIHIKSLLCWWQSVARLNKLHWFNNVLVLRDCLADVRNKLPNKFSNQRK